MKKILFLLLLVPAVTKAQTDVDNYTWDVVDSAAGTKSELFQKARDWAFDIMKNPKFAIQIQDSVAGKILIHIELIPKTGTLGGAVKSDMEIDVKDDKYRFLADKFYYYNFPNSEEQYLRDSNYPMAAKECPVKVLFTGKAKANALWNKTKKDIAQQIADLYLTLKSKMIESDNW